MRIGTRRAWSWKDRAFRGAAVIATFVALVAGCSATAADQAGSPSARAATNADPCRFVTADAMGNAFGRSLKSSKLVDICQYKGAGTELVVVKVAAGPEGTIMRHVKRASTQGQAGVERITTPVGEAYFDSLIPVFIGRVADHDVQIETTIEPLPRDAMIAVGTRIMETLAGKHGPR